MGITLRTEPADVALFCEEPEVPVHCDDPAEGTPTDSCMPIGEPAGGSGGGCSVGAAGSAGAPAWALLALGLVAVHRRRRRR